MLTIEGKKNKRKSNVTNMTDSEKNRIQGIKAFIEKCNPELKKEIDELYRLNKEFNLERNSKPSSFESRKKI